MNQPASEAAPRPVHAEPAHAEPAHAEALDVERLRADFPQLALEMRGRPLVYLDTAASSLKPRAVIDRISRFYRSEYANIHRGVYQLSADATRAYADARQAVQRFLGAREPREIVFCRGTTEAINLVAQTFGRSRLGPGDEVLVSGMEHHANIVPWQIVCEQTGARLRVIPIDDRGDLVLDELDDLLTERTKLLALAHVSNALGTVNPVQELTARAKAVGATVLIDGAQAALHMRVDVREIGCDFYAFSGHKALGPTGIGALYGRAELLAALPPYQAGGDMIRSVTFERTTYADIPQRFEAGTPHIAGAIGLHAALDYLTAVGLERIERYDAELLAYGTERLREVEGVRLIGEAEHKSGVLSFVMDGVHPHDIGTILDTMGIAIRAGHHCAQPVMDRFSLPATARASLAFYNTRQEIDAFVGALRATREVFGL